MGSLHFYIFTAKARRTQRILLKEIFLCGLCASAVILFCSAFSQVFSQIGQSDQYGSQADHIPGIDPAIKHAGNDSGKRQAHKGPDYENRKLAHFKIPALVLIISVDACKVETNNYMRSRRASIPGFYA
jgi:hypothetical protein